MKNSGLLFLVLFFCFYSCEDKEDINNINDFQESIAINSESSRIINEKFKPKFVSIIDETIIFCDLEKQEHFFAYSLPDLKFLGSFGYDNDNEISIKSPIFVGQIEKIGDKRMLSAYQMNNQKFISFDMDKALNKTLKLEDTKTIVLPSEIDEAVYMLKFNNNLIFGSGYTTRGEFFIYDEQSKKINWKNFIIDYNEDFMKSLDEADLLGIYKHGIIKSKPDNTKFVKAYMFSQKINVFDTKGNLELTISNGNVDKPEILPNNKFSDETKLFYSNVYLTDNYIYALNLNCKVNTNPTDVEIHVFDWNGNPIKEIKLNRGVGPLSPFAIDEKTKTIYMVNPVEDINYLSEFKF